MEFIEWDDFTPNYNAERYKLTNILCPVCKSQLYKDTGVVLTTYPPKYSYECRECNWKGCK